MERRHHDTQIKEPRKPTIQEDCFRCISPPSKEGKERLAVERMLSEGCPNTQPIVQGLSSETLRGEGAVRSEHGSASMPHVEEKCDAPPLKRHPALQPFSREHMAALIQSRTLQRAADGNLCVRRNAIAGFTRLWHAEIQEHFDEEERMLLPLILAPDLRQRLLDEHCKLRDLSAECDRDADAVAEKEEFLRRLGTLLHDHIRWEERVLFETVQRDHPDALSEFLPNATGAEESAAPSARAEADRSWPCLWRP